MKLCWFWITFHKMKNVYPLLSKKGWFSKSLNNKKLSYLSERSVKILIFLGIRRTKNCHFYQSGRWKFDIIGNTKNKKLAFLSERSVKIWHFWEYVKQKIVISIRADGVNLILLRIRRTKNCHFYQSGVWNFDYFGNGMNQFHSAVS